MRRHDISSFMLYANQNDTKKVLYKILCDFALIFSFKSLSLKT